MVRMGRLQCELTRAQIGWERLERKSVKPVSGYLGRAILPAFDAPKQSDTDHGLVRHEQRAINMAGGKARTRALVGAAIETSGHGTTKMELKLEKKLDGRRTDRLNYYLPTGRYMLERQVRRWEWNKLSRGNRRDRYESC
jgi:hypothetical protein